MNANGTIHYSRFISSTESYCGIKLNDGPGTTNLHSHTIFHKEVTCKNCRRKLTRDMIDEADGQPSHF